MIHHKAVILELIRHEACARRLAAHDLKSLAEFGYSEINSVIVDASEKAGEKVHAGQ
jgi:hypothetical protein